MTRFSTHEKTRQLTRLALLAALIIVLQLVSAIIAKFALLPVSITLTLVPVIIGAGLLGPRGGAELGAVFGAIVVINAAVGLDAGGNMLWNASPVLTILLCFAKGIAAGFVAGIVLQRLKNKPLRRTFLAAVLTPLTNTGIFLLFMLFGFKDVLIVWANGSPVGYYMLTGLVGINFIIELAVNVILAPTCVHILQSVKKQHTNY